MRTVLGCLLLLLLLPAIASAQGGLLTYPSVTLDANRLTNGDFETGDTTGWTGTGWAVDTTEVHGGTYSVKTTSCSSSLYQPQAVEEGKWYRMSAWVKFTDVSDGGFRILFNTRQNPFCAYGCGGTASESGTQDWHQVTATDIYISADWNGTFYLECYSTPIVGTGIWVDDVEFHEQLPPDIEAKLIQPSYRGYLWSDLDQEAVFEIVNNDGGTIESVITYDADPENPVTDTHGTNPGTVTLPLTGSATIAFRIQGEATQDYPQYYVQAINATERQTWPISWTDDNRFRINDTPTFLLGVYDSGLGTFPYQSGYTNQLDDYRRFDEIDDDLNIYLNYWWGGVQEPSLTPLMDEIEDRNILLFHTANCFSSAMGSAATGPALNNQTYSESLTAFPVHAGNYIMDECVNSLADDMFAKTVVARNWQPKGADLVVTGGGRVGSLDIWYDVGDIIGADAYPLIGAEPAGGYVFNDVARYAAGVREAVSDSRPFLMVLQFFKLYSTGRFPTTAELRNMSIMSIVEGAQGLMYWSIGNGTGALAVQCGASTVWCDPEPEYWERLKTVVSELKGLEAVFVGADDDTRLVASSNSNIVTKTKSAGYILAYNDTNQTQEVTFTWDQIVSAVAVKNEGDPSGDRSITPSSTQFSDTFTAYQSHVYQITDGGAPPDPELDIVDKLRGQATSTGVRVVWGDADLRSNVSCSAVLKDSGGGTLDTNVYSEGFATRSTSFTGLDAGTQYSVVVSCDNYEDATYSFSTLDATYGTATYTLSFAPSDVLPSAQKIKVYYSIPPGGTTSTTNESCASGCTVDLTLHRGVVYSIYYEWLDSGDNVIAAFTVPFEVMLDGPSAATCCASDASGPTMGDTDPSGSGTLPSTSYTLRAKATDSCGVEQMCFYYYYCGAGSGCTNPISESTLIGCTDVFDVDGWYGQLWNFPSCGAAPENNFTIWFEAEDNCGNKGQTYVDDVVLSGRGC